MAKLSKGTIGLLGEIVSLLNGAVASGLKLVNNLVSSGFKMAFQFNESAMAFSRQAGLTAKQAQAYTEVLTTRAKELGEKYGIAAEEVTKLERNLAKATGRVLMLSNAQADMQVAINRTVGEETANEFSQMMMRTMGAQIQTVQGAVSKAYAIAAKNGLDAAGMAAKVAQNLSMANRLTFRNGVDGLTKMVALSEKFGVNVQTIESAANSFMDLQDAIENSAKLTMLGGAAGGLGGNPLDMTYEANADPEAFAERLTKLAGGYAQFDAKTGMAKLNYMSRDMLKGMADAMHISLDEMVTMAKKQAEVTYKNNNFGRDLDRLSGGDEQKRNYLLNKTQIENGRMKMYSSKTGKYEDMSYFENPKGGKAEFEEMMRFSVMTDEEIVREQAEAVVSIKDRLEGYFTTIQGIFGEKIAGYIPQIKDFLGDLYRVIKPHFGEVAQNVKELVSTLFTKENITKVKDGIATIANAMIGMAKLLTSSWKWLIGGALLSPLLSAFGWFTTQWMLYQRRNAIGGGAPGTGGPAAGRNASYSWKQAKNYARNSYRMSGGGAKGLWNGGKALWRNSGTVRGAVGGGALTAIMAGYGIYDAISSYNDREKEIKENTELSDVEKKYEIKKAEKEKNSKLAGVGGGVAGSIIGGAIGTAIAPGLGTAIGAALGGWLGDMGGKALGDAVQGEPEVHHNGGVAGDGDTSGAVGRNILLESVIQGSPEVHHNGGVAGDGGASDSMNNVQIKNIVQEVHHNGGVAGNGAVSKNTQLTSIVQGEPELHHDNTSVAGDGGTRGARSKNTPLKSNEVSAILERGEVVVSLDAVNTLYTRMQTLQESVRALPVGNKEYFYTNASQSSQNTGNNQITVNDINVRFSGSIRLEGDNNYRNYDINDLVENKEFIRRLFSRPEVMNAIMNSLNTNTNIGVMHDSGWLYRGESNYLSGKLMNT